MKKVTYDKNGRSKPLNNRPKIEDVSILLEDWHNKVKSVKKEILGEINNRSEETKAMLVQIQEQYSEAIQSLLRQLVLEAELWTYRAGIEGLNFGVGFRGQVDLENYQSKFETWYKLINGPRCSEYWNHIIDSNICK